MNVAYDFKERSFNFVIAKDSIESIRNGNNISNSIYYTAGTEILFRKLKIVASNICKLKPGKLYQNPERIIYESSDIVLLRGKDDMPGIALKELPFELYFSNNALCILTALQEKKHAITHVVHVGENKKLTFFHDPKPTEFSKVTFLENISNSYKILYPHEIPPYPKRPKF